MKNIKKLLGILIFAFALNANAADTLFGQTDCGKWTASNTNTNKAWLLGYLSGLNNMYVSKTKDPLGKVNSADQIFVWMDNYCKKNPLKMVTTGAVALFFELEKE